VAEALARFRPDRRVGTETVTLADALGRVPADAIVAPHDLPGFARATVDGYAVRAVDTYGASEGLPAYLDVVGAVHMGAAPDITVRAGAVVSIPTGGALPDGADAVVMVEHTARTMDQTIELTRPVAPGDGLVRADDDVAAGGLLAPAGRPLRAQDIGVLAAAGITTLTVRPRPRVTIVSTGDEVVPPETPHLAPGQVRDATASALAAMVRQAGGAAHVHGIEPDDPARLGAALTAAVATSDLVVVSAGSSVGARDQTAEVIARLGPPGVWCHGLAIKPGKPTVLAQVGDVPVVGLPGNPMSALVVFRMIGVPLLHQVGGITAPPPRPLVDARLTRDVPSAAGRLDVVQVRLDDGDAEPIFGKSALLAVMVRADGFIVVDEDATGLYAGTAVQVERYV
jgi:molybdopterin molybdotransferase